jgi:hypothetical protein
MPKTGVLAGTHRSCADEFSRSVRSLSQMSAGDRSTIVCDVAALAPDVATVGALARLQLGARRSGFEIVLRGPSRALRELLTLAGLENALPVEPGGQPEEREELLGVEEERELSDPPV